MPIIEGLAVPAISPLLMPRRVLVTGPRTVQGSMPTYVSPLSADCFLLRLRLEHHEQEQKYKTKTLMS
jgi:hypothetical protein